MITRHWRQIVVADVKVIRRRSAPVAIGYIPEQRIEPLLLLSLSEPVCLILGQRTREEVRSFPLCIVDHFGLERDVRDVRAINDALRAPGQPVDGGEGLGEAHLVVEEVARD